MCRNYCSVERNRVICVITGEFPGRNDRAFCSCSPPPSFVSLIRLIPSKLRNSRDRINSRVNSVIKDTISGGNLAALWILNHTADVCRDPCCFGPNSLVVNTFTWLSMGSKMPTFLIARNSIRRPRVESRINFRGPWEARRSCFLSASQIQSPRWSEQKSPDVVYRNRDFTVPTCR